MIAYDKLVRDMVPQIIEAAGRQCGVRNRGFTLAEFERLRGTKREQRGGFERRLLLISASD